MGRTTEIERKIILKEMKQKAEWIDAEAHFKRSIIRVKIQDKLLLIVLSTISLNAWC